MILIKTIYRLFRKQILKYYYLEQNKGFEKLDKCFVDSNGIGYWRYGEDFTIPLQRVRYLNKKIQELNKGFSDDEYIKILTAIEGAINGGKKPDLVTVGFLVKELKDRRDLALHPDIMFDLAATIYIREDENPAEVAMSIHNEKIEQFKKDSVEGLYDFFYNAGLEKYIPYLTKLEGEWEEYWKESTIKIKAMNTMLNQITTG
jgi:hypothetical protein